MQPILKIENLGKTYSGGLVALKNINLDIRRGEIFALLGPNGAGKTTLIGIICGLVNATSGRALVDGHDAQRDPRSARALVGLVPQELATEAFEAVQAAVTFSRGLFGHAPNPALIEKVLRSLSLWDKRDAKIMTLSGGMKRRVMIAKALVHEPKLLFLDEPSAGVDVELRRDMWQLVRDLRDNGVTIILTTHYIEEAEEMADRIGIINKGELMLVEDKSTLIRKLGRKELRLHLVQKLDAVPATLAAYALTLAEDGMTLVFTFNNDEQRAMITSLLRELNQASIDFRDLETQQSSLEDIFVSLVRGAGMNLHAVRAIYRFEMARTFRTTVQSILTPVLTTSLYFVVFGSAIGSRMTEIDGIAFAAFIVPGLIMLSVLNESIGNASFGIYFPKWSGTIYELLSAPVGAAEIVLGYVGAAATKSMLVGLIILATSTLFVPLQVLHPIWMLVFLALTALTFSLFGFVLGIWATSWEKLQFVPALIVTPLTFLGGSFYSIDMLPPVWRAITLFNPVVYLISGFRWSFYGKADVAIGVSFTIIIGIMLACLALITWMIRTGWRLRH